MEKEQIQNIERKKRSLKRYKKNKALIERLEEKLYVMDKRITSISSPRFSDMPKGGGTPVTNEDLILEKVELEHRIERLRKKGYTLRAEILDEIDTLEDARYAEVLESFFIDCKTLESIAEEEGYTVRHVYRLYSEAIKYLTVSGQ